MEQHDLEIEITPSGQVKVHIAGVKGKECMRYVNLLEEILGSAGQVDHTHEYYEPPTGVEIEVEGSTEG